MAFTIVDKNGKDLGKLKGIQTADFEIGGNNNFKLKFLLDDWESDDVIKEAYRIGWEGHEIGGIIKDIIVNTQSNYVSLEGRGWRGHLSKKVIVPPPGLSHLVVNGDVNDILRQLIDKEFDGIIKGKSGKSGIMIKDFQFPRYCTLVDGISQMLESIGQKIRIQYVQSSLDKGIKKDGYAEISAVPIFDFSDTLELSNLGRIHRIAKKIESGVNHLICLGKGELENRLVLHLYVQEDGTIGPVQFYKGVHEIAETYELSSVDNPEELTRQGTEKLLKLKSVNSIELNIEDDQDLEIGDIVSGTERITGLSGNEVITRIIVKIDDAGNISKRFKAGEK